MGFVGFINWNRIFVRTVRTALQVLVATLPATLTLSAAGALPPLHSVGHTLVVAGAFAGWASLLTFLQNLLEEVNNLDGKFQE